MKYTVFVFFPCRPNTHSLKLIWSYLHSRLLCSRLKFNSEAHPHYHCHARAVDCHLGQGWGWAWGGNVGEVAKVPDKRGLISELCIWPFELTSWTDVEESAASLPPWLPFKQKFPCAHSPCSGPIASTVDWCVIHWWLVSFVSAFLTHFLILQNQLRVSATSCANSLKWYSLFSLTQIYIMKIFLKLCFNSHLHSLKGTY